MVHMARVWLVQNGEVVVDLLAKLALTWPYVLRVLTHVNADWDYVKRLSESLC